MNIPFSSPASIGIFGPSQVGKSSLLVKLLLSYNEVFTREVTFILYCYSIKLDVFPHLKEKLGNIISFNQGIPSKESIEEITSKGNHAHGVIVLDDLMLEVNNSPDIVTLFTVGSHHLNITLIFLSQNLFPRGKYSRSISLNLQYIILFKNLSDNLQIKSRVRQIFPGKSKEFNSVFKDATREPYGYLLLDLSPTGDDEYRIRTHILPYERGIVYKLD